MRKNLNSLTKPELIKVGDISIEQNANKSKIGIKGFSFLKFLIFHKKPKAGYGSCRACDCKGYISKHNGSHECKNCNHHYDRHN